MKRLTNQKGMTAIGWLFVLVLVLVFAIIAIKLIPMYLDGFKVYSSLESLQNDSQAKGKPAIEIRKLLMRRLDVNMVNDVSPQDISITRSRNGVTVSVDYEARRSLFGNLSVVVAFKKSVEISQ